MRRAIIHATVCYAMICALLVVGIDATAHAQSTFSSIVGVVRDATQAVVPGASVKIQSLDDNSVRSTTSDENGSFDFVNLKPGRYTLSARAEGLPNSKWDRRSWLRGRRYGSTLSLR